MWKSEAWDVDSGMGWDPFLSRAGNIWTCLGPVLHLTGRKLGFQREKGLVEVMQLVLSYRMERGPLTPNQGGWKHEWWGSGLDSATEGL